MNKSCLNKPSGNHHIYLSIETGVDTDAGSELTGKKRITHRSNPIPSDGHFHAADPVHLLSLFVADNHFQRNGRLRTIHQHIVESQTSLIVGNNNGNGNNAVTRAATAGDGTSVNRCIMEIYLNDELYSRQIGAIQPDGLTAGFDVRLVTSQTYKFVFWADHVESVEGDAIKTDLHYNTADLRNISMKGIITEAVRTIRGMLSLPVWRSW